MRTGVLLINLGTPASCSSRDVRKYLREFLSDPYVIDIHPLARWLLLNLIILPTRPKKSAAAYQKIWTAQGSPLLVNSLALANNAQQILGKNYQVALGMRYGKPSIASAVEQLRNCDNIIIFPLFPQYSLAATQTAIAAAKKCVEQYWSETQIKISKDFYTQSGFIQAQAKLIQPALQQHNLANTKIIFSYHGLPERQIKKVSRCENCDGQQACPLITTNNRYCYRAQCYATSQAIADILQLQPQQYLTSFQSRLGRTPWIKPYTDLILPQLIEQNITELIIACPSFVCDCLETLEEIGIRARAQWQELGGEKLTLVPCLNADAHWLPSILP